MNKKLLGNLLLFIAAFIWGTAFVSQRVGMDYIGPLTFNAVRSFIASLALVPVILFLRRGGRVPSPQVRRATRVGGLLCGLVLFAASASQQLGLVDTAAGKAGFLTALYIVIVPLAGLFFSRRPGPLVWFAVALAAAGLYLLCIREGFAVSRGDLLLIACAVLYTGHILVIAHYSTRADSVALSAIQFAVTGVLSLAAAFLFETPRLSPILDCWGPLLYAAVLSSAVAYTLQIVGQKHTDPTVASLLMSLEAVFSALAGWIVLGETFTGRECVGALLLFAAIILAQLPARRGGSPAPDIKT